ncbi:recombinase family protein [Hydromonas duriensis]|uniref:DNA invertase Pin-like site-specific DNA recombinase n=1 Tax=Hydromonas duriensis TaxID=1527608 RepID=A0A4R6Y465_9BURK|nr:recombinase family protein [Hydromonas duriensis]TDR27805.1 DNA invertase Pin-like site-specific DNA recombinase [Hydromonas duriensis]
MIIGYARTSTIEQQAGFDAQIKELQSVGCTKIFQEQVSSQSKRIQLEAALEYARDGDVFVVTKLDRLARSMRDLMTIIDGLSSKNVTVRILNLGLDTQTPTAKLILNVLGSIAQFEREMMLERQREGIAKAKADGKYRGRKPISDEQRLSILRLSHDGFTKAVIAKQLNVGEATVYRILAEERKLKAI